MKKQIFSILMVTIMMVTAACSPEMPAIFKDADAIYFSAPSDSIAYTFAKYPNRMTDTIKLPVSVLGSPAPSEREIAFEVLTGADINAKEGIHYKLLPPYKMPANKVSTTLPVVVYRTGDL